MSCTAYGKTIGADSVTVRVAPEGRQCSVWAFLAAAMVPAAAPPAAPITVPRVPPPSTRPAMAPMIAPVMTFPLSPPLETRRSAMAMSSPTRTVPCTGTSSPFTCTLRTRNANVPSAAGGANSTSIGVPAGSVAPSGPFTATASSTTMRSPGRLAREQIAALVFPDRAVPAASARDGSGVGPGAEAGAGAGAGAAIGDSATGAGAGAEIIGSRDGPGAPGARGERGVARTI